MKWSIHPFKEKPLKSFFLIIFLIFLTLTLFTIYPNWIFVISTMSVMLISLRGYLFKAEYELLNDYLSVKMLAFEYRKKYSDFKKVYIGKTAFLMSPFSYKTKLNRYRGVYIPFPALLREKIIYFMNGKFKDVVIVER